MVKIVRTPQGRPSGRSQPNLGLTGGIFDQLLVQGIRRGQVPAQTMKARNWFRDQAKRITDNSPTAFMRQERQRLIEAKIARPVRTGDMVMYFYDAKHKKTLPYWDKFPLVFLIEKYDDGWLGINLHYLPLPYRAKLMDALYSVSTDKRFDDRTRLLINYQILKSATKFKWFSPCVKRYLKSHVRSKFLRVHAAEWDIALFLPFEQFQKASKQQVWSDSLEKVRKASVRRRRENRAARVARGS